MKRATLGLSILAMAAGVAAMAMLPVGCGSKGKGGDVIVIGEYGSLAGSKATFGQSTHNGILMAVHERNEKGGVKGKTVVLKTEDVMGKSEQVGPAVTRLITKDGAVAILGEVASSLSIAGAGVCKQYNVPMISPSSTNPKVTAIGDMIFRVCFTDEFQGHTQARFARENLKAQTAAILYDQASAYSKGLRDFVTAEFEAQGGKILLAEAYTEGDSDFGSQLGKIRDRHPDVLFVPGYYTEVGKIAEQARRLGVKAAMVGGDGWDSSTLIQNAGAAVEGHYYSNHCSYEDARPRDFRARYVKAYGHEPDALAALGYDAAQILMAAIEQSPSLSPADLTKAIAQTRDFDAVTGRITIDAKRNASKAAVIIQIKGGKRVPVAKIEPRG